MFVMEHYTQESQLDPLLECVTVWMDLLDHRLFNIQNDDSLYK